MLIRHERHLSTLIVSITSCAVAGKLISDGLDCPWQCVSGIGAWIGFAGWVVVSSAQRVEPKTQPVFSNETKITMINENSGIRSELPLSLPDLVRTAEVVVSSYYEFSPRLLAGRGKVLSRDQFDIFSSSLQRRGFVDHIGRDYKLTRPGKALMRMLANNQFGNVTKLV